MLSLHGLVIIAEVPDVIIPTKYGAVLKLQVASDNGKGGTHRHMMDLIIPQDKIEDAKQKLQVGSVCEIVHGTWREYESQFAKPEYAGKNYSRINIVADWKNLKFLRIPMYYEKLSGITENKTETVKE